MIISINEVTIQGNLGKDPDLRYTPSGKAVVHLSVATNRRWTGKDGKKETAVTWHSVIAWGATAENASKYLKKGDGVLVKGRLDTRSYESKGETHYVVEVVALSIQYDTKKRTTNSENASNIPVPTDTEDIPF